jgi:two-component system response regulator RegA
MSDAMTPEPARTVLLVEDDDTFRNRLARAFRDRGFLVTEAASVEEAATAARDDTPEPRSSICGCRADPGSTWSATCWRSIRRRRWWC